MFVVLVNVSQVLIYTRTMSLRPKQPLWEDGAAQAVTSAADQTSALHVVHRWLVTQEHSNKIITKRMHLILRRAVIPATLKNVIAPIVG